MKRFLFVAAALALLGLAGQASAQEHPEQPFLETHEGASYLVEEKSGLYQNITHKLTLEEYAVYLTLVIPEHHPFQEVYADYLDAEIDFCLLQHRYSEKHPKYLAGAQRTEISKQLLKKCADLIYKVGWAIETK